MVNMSVRVVLNSPNGKSQIEVNASEIERFTAQGFTVVEEKKSAAKSATKARGVDSDGNI